VTANGIVWIAGDAQPGELIIRFSAYWDSGTSVAEQMSSVTKAVDAIRGGLERTDDVRIRFDGWDYFWAGRGPMPEGLVGSVTLVG
jgi:hypothetical protein